MGFMKSPCMVVVLVLFSGLQPALTKEPPHTLIGYTEMQTARPGGRHANIRTMRAMLIQPDGLGRRMVGQNLADDPESWTQFAGWSPDGKTSIIYRGWESAENARWEEEHKDFRFSKEGWLLDSFLVDLTTDKAINVTAIDRVSHYNSGLFFMPDQHTLGFTPLINGVSKPFVMNLDGHGKRDVSGEGGGFAYGYSASPDGRSISYHENYQIHLANSDGSNKRRIDTGNPFNFGPSWSADSQWLLFISGTHGHSNLYLTRRDSSDLRKFVDLGGYQGSVSFLDVEDFHHGSSDIPVWSIDGKSIFYTAQVGPNVELFQKTLEGQTTQLTKTPTGTLQYHPQPSRDGEWLVYGSKRDGVRQIFLMKLSDRSETRVTNIKAGHGAMWPHWQPR